jgi:hypothetical protein
LRVQQPLELSEHDLSLSVHVFLLAAQRQCTLFGYATFALREMPVEAPSSLPFPRVEITLADTFLN